MNEDHNWELFFWVGGGLAAILYAISTWLGSIVWNKTFANENAAQKLANDVKNLQDAFMRQQVEINELKGMKEAVGEMRIDFRYMKDDMAKAAEGIANIERHIIDSQAKKIKLLQKRIDEEDEI